MKTRLPSASLFAALGSVVSLGAQALMAVFLLKLFDATAVGQFSVVSQIAFCWATLALAQSPLSLLAERRTTAHAAASNAWGQSAVRLLWIGPWALLALWWSTRSAGAPHWSALVPWVCGIATLQMSWLLAQSLTLRQPSPAAVAGVRLLPPVLAALIAWLGAVVLGQTGSATLLLSALLGYGAGALWMLPALRHAASATANHPLDLATATAPGPGDARSTRLKLLHTLTDVTVSGLLAVQWQALYGTAEAGMLLVLLRVFGFIPALVHSAWAQVVMSQGDEPDRHPGRTSLRMAALACALVLLLALAIDTALRLDWLQASWQGLLGYLWPLALWQMAASAMAAHAHLPFAHGRTVRFSRQCIAMNAAMLALLLAPMLPWPLLQMGAHPHLLLISGFMALALLAQALDHGLHRQSR